MELENRIQALIAVGAAVSANCQPCLQSTVALAAESGASEREIAEAIEVGKRVRRGAASKMDKFVFELHPAVPSSATADTGCGCGLI
ncbi:MAG TPA: carboxymuconolactone decarboxylase family protein [Anaerolineales bacterium]|nr:carboxymuconolactone decarboxylase family protein [Anaerolineales bacterium]